jgi:hypothetical protein
MKLIEELSGPDEARAYLLQGLCLQRVLPPRTLEPALAWALEMASEGMPLPPTCLVADLGHMAFGMDWESKEARALPPVPGAPSELLRMYEDYVIGKAVADWTFLRAAETLRHYHGRDRARGLAFLINQFRERAGFGGVELSPGWIKSLLQTPPEQALAQAAETILEGTLLPKLEKQMKWLVSGARRTAEMLAEADVFELEHRTALDEFGQRLALRQVLFAAEKFEKALPSHRLKPLAGRQEVPTRVLDEDTYPVGGYTSLSTRGSVESLLHSQLAYMEEADRRPDLFDIKYLRDELLYYSRDENQFLRRRRTFVFVLYPDLIHARFKDAALPYQRIVLLWALLQVTVHKLTEWLSTDALKFVFYFLGQEGEDADEMVEPLEDERKLLQTLQREQITNQTVEVVTQLQEVPEQAPRAVTMEEVTAQCTLRSRRSLCHALLVSTQPRQLVPEDTVVTRLVVDGPVPALAAVDEPLVAPDEETPLEGWQEILQELLERWI